MATDRTDFENFPSICKGDPCFRPINPKKEINGRSGKGNRHATHGATGCAAPGGSRPSSDGPGGPGGRAAAPGGVRPGREGGGAGPRGRRRGGGGAAGGGAGGGGARGPGRGPPPGGGGRRARRGPGGAAGTRGEGGGREPGVETVDTVRTRGGRWRGGAGGRAVRGRDGARAPSGKRGYPGAGGPPGEGGGGGGGPLRGGAGAGGPPGTAGGVENVWETDLEVRPIGIEKMPGHRKGGAPSRLKSTFHPYEGEDLEGRATGPRGGAPSGPTGPFSRRGVPHGGPLPPG